MSGSGSTSSADALVFVPGPQAAVPPQLEAYALLVGPQATAGTAPKAQWQTWHLGIGQGRTRTVEQGIVSREVGVEIEIEIEWTGRAEAALRRDHQRLTLRCGTPDPKPASSTASPRKT